MIARTLAIGAAGLFAASTASASITSVDPFVGEAWELFELIGPPGPTPGPAQIFDGEAVIADQLAGMLMIANSLYSTVTETQILPYNGNLMGGFVSGFGAIDFDTPVSEFGGYFGTADVLTGGTVVFIGADGQSIGSEPLDLALGEWDWFGWSSDAPIHRIEFYCGETPSAPIVLDDLQVNYVVPTPATGALLGLAGLAAIRRRRQA